MGELIDKLKELRGQSHKPPDVRKGGVDFVDILKVEDPQHISVAEGKWGSTNPEGRAAQRRIEGTGREQDMSVESLVDLQAFQQLKVSIQTGVRNRVKKVLRFLGD